MAMVMFWVGVWLLSMLLLTAFVGQWNACRYHSESGWQTLLEIIVEHYGLEVDQSALTIFVCLVPVVMDACVKLWTCNCHFYAISSRLCLNSSPFVPKGDKYISGNETSLVWTTAAGGVSMRPAKSSLKYKP
ncbi:hypothetical protein ACSQ67_009603 [Phaseolus vulgaris]